MEGVRGNVREGYGGLALIITWYGKDEFAQDATNLFLVVGLLFIVVFEASIFFKPSFDL